MFGSGVSPTHPRNTITKNNLYECWKCEKQHPSLVLMWFPCSWHGALGEGKYPWECMHKKRHYLGISHKQQWSNSETRRVLCKQERTDMLKTTVWWGKNNKYSSSFPHTHINTSNNKAALAENTNRCRAEILNHQPSLYLYNQTLYYVKKQNGWKCLVTLYILYDIRHILCTPSLLGRWWCLAEMTGTVPCHEAVRARRLGF